MPARRVWLTLHRWIGLACALFVLVMGATGAALVFENDIDRALNPSTSYVTPGVQPLPLARLVARANAAQPADPVGAIRLADRPDLTYELSARRRHSIFVNEYTGEILGTRDREKSLARVIHLVHTRLDGGGGGERVSAAATIGLLILSISGLVLWWPRKILRVRTGGSWIRTNLDLHHVVGFLSSALIVVITLSAATIAFESVADPLMLRLNAAPELDTSRLKSIPEPGLTPVSPDDALATARAILPGAAVTSVGLPGGPAGIYRLLMRFPEDRTPAGRSRVYIDQYTGAVLAVENTRTAQLGRRLVNLKRSLHTGDIYGEPTRALYFVVSLAIVLQAITGVIGWWNARAARSRRNEHSR
jgi:uncharacterized iron-regulated membrane protein